MYICTHTWYARTSFVKSSCQRRPFTYPPYVSSLKKTHPSQHTHLEQELVGAGIFLVAFAPRLVFWHSGPMYNQLNTDTGSGLRSAQVRTRVWPELKPKLQPRHRPRHKPSTPAHTQERGGPRRGARSATSTTCACV